MKEDDKQVPEDIVEDTASKDLKLNDDSRAALQQYFNENLLGKVFEL
jgi:hypothetical protein